jgi:hypothetical protein
LNSYSNNNLTNFLGNLTSNPTFNSIFLVGGLIQIVFVMIIIRKTFRDNSYYSSMSWFRAFSYALLFVGGAPILAQGISALLVIGLPYLTPYLDVLTLLGRFSTIDENTASTTRPWAYALALLASAGFLVWRIRSLKSRSFTWIHAGQVALFAFFANILFQLLVYGILVAVG